MADYIEREKAIALILEQKENEPLPFDDMDAGWNAGLSCAVGQIESLPSADVVERKHGKWIDDGDCLICSNCHKAFTFGGSNFCPNCGARMDGEDDVV